MYAMIAAVQPGNVSFHAPVLESPIVRELTDFELDFVSGGDVVSGLGMIAGGAIAIGSGLALTGLAAGLVIGGGFALVALGGYEIYVSVAN